MRKTPEDYTQDIVKIISSIVAHIFVGFCLFVLTAVIVECYIRPEKIVDVVIVILKFVGVIFTAFTLVGSVHVAGWLIWKWKNTNG